ncbi:DUF1295 domain-containing protein [Stieleria sp. TO1_6]|uniref:DUF1295 domain-containing protein n=1 Tax=Stieleria tagensis TaxID=2956795 RepID=UPI00209B453D|nr:DUF1295 domain-containing protein [Stieleria tagensis]MCO8122054.1 DUF1295 domain-containing protein [Stieleria tagensis]
MNAPLVESLWTCAAAIVSLFVCVWLISLPLRDVSIVDIAWGLGFVLVVWTAFLFHAEPDRGWLVIGLTTLWGVRLAAYLAYRNHGCEEDHRYRKMRDRWGSSFPLVSLFTVFLLQAAVMWVVSLPLQTAFVGAEPTSAWIQGIGLLLWTVGFGFETVGDWQLARFKSDPDNAGQVLDTGLWRYTRHPNYFGDFLVWWGLYLVAVASSHVWWSVVGPITISVFLLRVSGVTLLEKSLKDSKPDYQRYIERTNAFFPGPPR